MKVKDLVTGQIGNLPDAELKQYAGRYIPLETSGNVAMQTPSTPQTQSAQPNAFNQGVLGFLTNQLPLLGAVGAGALTAPLELAPGIGAAANVGAAGVGAAGGEALRQLLQGKPTNPQEIATQGAFGLVGGGIGEATGPVLKLLSKVPVAGPVIEGITKLGDTALSKIFGPGENVALAKSEGLIGSGDIKTIVNKTAQKLAKVGQSLGNGLDTAASRGIGMASGEIDKIVENAIPKISNLSPLEKEQLASNVRQIYKNMIGPETGLETLKGEANVPVNILHEFQKEVGKSAAWGAETPSLEQQYARNLYFDLSKKIGEKVPEMANLNRRYAGLKAISDHVDQVANYISNPGARTSLLSPSNFARSPGFLTGLGQAGELAPKAAGQIISRLGQTPPQSQQDITSLQNQPQYSRANLEKAYEWEVTHNPYGPGVNNIRNLINTLYPPSITRMLLQGAQNAIGQVQ